MCGLEAASQTAAASLASFLPPYSPELNPIEIVWKQLKYHWRSFKTWAKDKLLTEVRELLDGYGSKFHVSFK